MDESIRLASTAVNGRFVEVEGDYGFGEPEQALRAIDTLLGEIAETGTAGQQADLRRIVRSPVPELSPRQREVLALLAQGKTTREIAAALVLSERTVERHIADLYARIGVRNRAEATAYELNRAATAGAAAMGVSTQ